MPTTRSLNGLSPLERLNFLVTNRLPRRWLTLAVGRYSKIESPLLARLSIGVWRLFADDLRLGEAQHRKFRSLHDCFIRELKPGARPVAGDPALLVSPCDAVVGEFGKVRDFEVLQAKGFPYELRDLLGSGAAAAPFRNARFVTLRLKSSMHHHFHAPCDGRVGSITYLSGDACRRQVLFHHCPKLEGNAIRTRELQIRYGRRQRPGLRGRHGRAVGQFPCEPEKALPPSQDERVIGTVAGEEAFLGVLVVGDGFREAARVVNRSIEVASERGKALLPRNYGPGRQSAVGCGAAKFPRH